MAERRRDEPAPFDRDPPALTAPAARGHAPEIPEALGDGFLVRVADRTPRRLVSETEQHAHALRRRERHIEAGDALLALRDQAAAVARSHPIEDPRQRLAVHR